MFFILSKLLVIFIYPLTWVFVLLVAGLIVKNSRLKRKFLTSSIIILYLFSIPVLLNWFADRWDIGPVQLKNQRPYSCAIVLGGFSSEDSNGNGFFNTSADRFIQGLKLITTGKASHILITGGNAAIFHDNFTESDWVKTQLTEFKVPDSCILIENRSRNTIENAAFSKVMLNNGHLLPPYILITSGFHMRRSLGIFEHTKIDVIPDACNYIDGKGKFSFTDLLPNAGTFSDWDFYIKEVIGSAVNYLKWHL